MTASAPFALVLLYDHPSQIGFLGSELQPHAARVDLNGDQQQTIFDLRNRAQLSLVEAFESDTPASGRGRSRNRLDEIAFIPHPEPSAAEDAGGSDEVEPASPVMPADASGTSDPPAPHSGEEVEPDEPPASEAGPSTPAAPSSPDRTCVDCGQRHETVADALACPAERHPPPVPRTTLLDRIATLVAEHPDREWSIGQITEHVATPRDEATVGQLAARLVRQGRIRRIARGRYQALDPASADEAQAELEELQTQVLTHLEATGGSRTVSELAKDLDSSVDQVRRACAVLAVQHQIDRVDSRTYRYLDPEDRAARKREARRRGAAADAAFAHG